MRHVFNQSELKIRLQFGYHTPIQNAEFSVSSSKQVTRVGIAMQHPSLQHHSQISIHGNTAENADIVFPTSVQPLANHPLRSQHFPRSQFVQHRGRKHHTRQRSLRNAFHERLRIDCLFDVIQFIDKTNTPCINRANQIRIQVESSLKKGCCFSNQVHIQGDLVHDIRSLHLHSNFSFGGRTIFGRRADGGTVNLPQTGGGNGFIRKLDKQIVNRGTQFILDDFSCFGSGEGRHLILKRLQSADVRGAE
mmetsp:Transcript_26357/g.55556  ORF Transcript_26357/g.55556 Transcript_26357/m.55556 type:complete len:249 (+) Transcript_26357:1191-1937(+)